MRVLLLVDVINSFFPGESMGVVGAREIVPTINELMRRGQYDLIVAVNDAHPDDHVSFLENHPGAKRGDVVTLANGTVQMVWPKHGRPETFGGSFHSDLEVKLIHHVLQKGTDKDVDSYSAFFDNNRNRETALRALIEMIAERTATPNKNIRVDTVGLALDYCVGWSAKDAASLGFQSYIVRDATRGIYPGVKSEIQVIKELEHYGVKMTTSAEILEEIARISARESHLERRIAVPLAP